jgi:hypothetical protein
MKRIWFKPDCRRWIIEGKKTRTFRKGRKFGLYEVVEGSWYKPKPTGLKVMLKPLFYTHRDTVMNREFDKEGDFKTPEEFMKWLKNNRLNLPEWGWLHEIEKLKD